MVHAGVRGFEVAGAIDREHKRELLVGEWIVASNAGLLRDEETLPSTAAGGSTAARYAETMGNSGADATRRIRHQRDLTGEA
jgi:hypothetical protein